MALGNVDESRDTRHQEEVIKDTAGNAFAGTKLYPDANAN